jgi:MFS family permease
VFRCKGEGAGDLERGKPLRTLRRDRPYERLNITGIRGLTEAEIAKPVEPGPSMTYLGGRPLWRFVLWYGLATVTIFAGLNVIIAILLTNQVQALDFAHWFTGADAAVNLTVLTNLRAAVAGGQVATADQQRLLHLLAQFDASRAQALALVTSLGSLGTLFTQPIVGALSDRTRTPLGRRAPWLLFGSIVSACLLVGVRLAPTVAVLALLWCVTLTLLNMASGPLNATVADRIPESRLETVSAVGGLEYYIGGLAGVVVAGAVFASLGLNIYFLVSVLIVAGIVGFVLLNRDRPSTALHVLPHRRGNFFRGFLVPLSDSDFRWVWLARIVLVFGYGTSAALSFYMLQSYITPALSAAQATRTVPLLSIVGLPATLVALVISGRLSDKLGRRKPFVIAASLLMAVAMAVPLLWPTLIALFIQTFLASLAFGIYLPVDQALFIDVLPDKNAAGRDLGISNVASNLGLAIAPIMAAQVVALTGGYRMIWVVALVLVLVAAVVIVPVKRAR